MKSNESKCSFPGCQKPLCAKGLCNTHWAQNKRQGALTPIKTHETAHDRFLRQTIKSSDPSGCWIFTGNGKGSGKSVKTEGVGYGQLYHNGKKCMAHRYSYEYYKNETIPDGLQLDHLCRVKNCVNPDHLQIVTQDENLRRMNYAISLKQRVSMLEKKVQSLVEFLSSLGYNEADLEKLL